MSFFSKMERKYTKFAIPHLIKYVLVLYGLGYLLAFVAPGFYAEWLMLDIDKVLHGQVWRIVTFLIQPPDTPFYFLIFFLLLYDMIGEALENALGTYVFNLFYFSGVIFNILAVIIIYVATLLVTGKGFSYPITLTYINESLFLAFALFYPDVRLLLYFIIPVKAKWLGIFAGGVIGYQIIACIRNGLYGNGLISICEGIAILVAMANFLILFFATRKFRRARFGVIKRRAEFTRSVERAKRETGQSRFTAISRHKCAICGRTEHDNPNLEFRFCSKCNGNYEYCTDHLYTHVHVGAAGGEETSETAGNAGESTTTGESDRNESNGL